MKLHRDESKGGRTLEHRYEADQPAEQPGNPAGVAEGTCDLKTHTHEGPDHDETCDTGVTAHVDDFALEESVPGGGIPGYEGEESGGG